MSIRFELLSLDYLLVDTLYHGREGITQAAAARSRSEQLLRVFPMSGDVLGSFMISEIPNRDLGLTSFDLEERNRHLVALGRLMCPWKGCLDSIWDASHLPIEAHVQALEEACASFYCQSFFDNFGRAPIIPCRLPPRSLARPEPVTFADSVTSAQPSLYFFVNSSHISQTLLLCRPRCCSCYCHMTYNMISCSLLHPVLWEVSGLCGVSLSFLSPHILACSACKFYGFQQEPLLGQGWDWYWVSIIEEEVLRSYLGIYQ